MDQSDASGVQIDTTCNRTLLTVIFASAMRSEHGFILTLDRKPTLTCASNTAGVNILRRASRHGLAVPAFENACRTVLHVAREFIDERLVNSDVVQMSKVNIDQMQQVRLVLSTKPSSIHLPPLMLRIGNFTSSNRIFVSVTRSINVRAGLFDF